MKKLILSAVAAFTFSAAHATDIAVVDLDKVVQSSTYLQQQNTQLKNSVQGQTSQIEKLQKELVELQKKGQASKNQAERDKLAKEFETKANQLNGLQQQVQTKVQSTLQNVNKTFEGRVTSVAEQLRKEAKVDLIINKNAVLAADAKADLTDKMIQKVNAIK
jgi:outer membrane protein